MNKHPFLKQMASGFTLIEVIIYSALVSLIMMSVFVVVYYVIEANDRSMAKFIAEEEANFLLKKISWVLNGVSAINSPAAGASDSKLSVNKINFPDNPVVIDFEANNIRIKRGAKEAVVLNSQNIAIANLEFKHLAPTGNRPAGVKASFNINARPHNVTIYLRK